MDRSQIALEISMAAGAILVRICGQRIMLPDGTPDRVQHLARSYLQPDELAAFEILNRVGGCTGVRVVQRGGSNDNTK